MTSGNWTPEAIHREKSNIEEWGRPGVFASPTRECHGATPNESTCCAFGCCSCKIVSWSYGWLCWCADGWMEDSWEDCIRALETHMLREYHK